MGWFWKMLGYEETTPLMEHLGEGAKRSQGVVEPSKSDIADQFLLSGLDYRGQASTARYLDAAGISGKTSGKLVLPFLPGVEGKTGLDVKGAPFRFLLAAYQVDDLPQHPNRAPILVASMRGQWASLKLSVEGEYSLLGDDDDDDPKSLLSKAIEYVGFAWEPSIKLGGGAGYEGVYTRASDKLPGWFLKQSRQDIKGRIIECLEGKEQVKGTEGWEFNERCSLWMWTQTGEGKMDVSAGIKAAVPALWKSASLRQHLVSGKKLSGELQVKLPTLEGSYKVSSYRLQTWGYNYVVSTQDTRIVYTQVGGKQLELSASLKTEPLWGEEDEEDEDAPKASLDLDLGQGLKGQLREKALNKLVVDPLRGSMVDEHLKLDKVKPFGDDWELLRGMRYTSAQAYWHSARPEELLPGSGFVVGQSVCIPFLTDRFYAGLPPWKIDPTGKTVGKSTRKRRNQRWHASGAYRYLRMLAAALRVPPEALEEVLLSPVVMETVAGWGQMQEQGSASAVGAVLLEAAFGTTLQMSGRPGLDQARDRGIYPDFRELMQKNVDDGSGTYRNLQAIRVRVRLADQKEEDTTVFKLGLKFDLPAWPKIALGAVGIEAEGGVSLALTRSTKIEHQGCFDLFVRWFGGFQGQDSVSMPRGAVAPPVMLT